MSQYANYFECDAWLGETQSAEVFAVQLQQNRWRNCYRRCGIGASIKHANFAEGTSRTLNCDQLLATTRGQFDDLDRTFLDDQKIAAPLTFGEEDFS